MSHTTRTSPRRLTAPSVPAQTTWRLHVLGSGDELHAGSVYQLERGDTVIGRSPSQGTLGIAFDDPTMSREHVKFTVRGGSDPVQATDLGSRNGTFLGGRPLVTARAGHGAVVRAGAMVAVLESDAGRWTDASEPTADVPGRSATARELRAELGLAAADALPVLLQGPTGSGKEFAATELHRRTGRSGRLVRVNVAAIPAMLFESELFGHSKGAFSGAADSRPGRIREAAGGTLVLDEIGELPADLQPKLLRALEEGVVRPVGASRDVPVDVKFCAATNADLALLVQEGRFRGDLAARLCQHVVRLPGLAQRRSDLVDLANVVHPLIRRGHAKPWQDALTPDALEAMLLHRWPYNLRDLKACLVRASSWESGGCIGIDALPAELLDSARVTPDAEVTQAASEPTRKARTGRPSPDELHEALRRHRGNVEAIAREHGVYRRQVYRWLRYAGIEADSVDRYRR